MLETAPGPDRSSIEQRLDSGKQTREFLVSQADKVLEQLRLLQGLMRDQLKRGPEYDVFSKRLEVLKDAQKTLDEVKHALKGTNEAAEWQRIAVEGMKSVQSLFQSAAQQNGGNKNFFEGIAKAVADISRTVEAGKRSEDMVFLPHSVDYGHILPKVKKTEEDLIHSGFPKPETRDLVRSTVFELIATLGQQDKKREEALSTSKALIEDYVNLFEEEQRLRQLIDAGKKGLKVDEGAIRQREKAKYDGLRHQRVVQLRDELDTINREQSNPSQSSQLAHGNARDDINRLTAEEKKAVEEGIKAAYEEAARAAGNEDYFTNLDRLEEVTGRMEEIVRFLQIMVDTSNKVKKAIETIVGTGDKKKKPTEDQNSETVELMKNLDFTKAEMDVEDTKVPDSSYSTPVDVLAQSLGVPNLNMRLMTLAQKYAVPEEETSAPAVEVAPLVTTPETPETAAPEKAADDTEATRHPDYTGEETEEREEEELEEDMEDEEQDQMEEEDEEAETEVDEEQAEEDQEDEDEENEEDEEDEDDQDPNAPKA